MYCSIAWNYWETVTDSAQTFQVIQNEGVVDGDDDDDDIIGNDDL